MTLANESAGIGVWELDIETDTLVWDDQMRRLYGREPAESSSGYETWVSLVHPDDRSRAIREVDLALNGSRVFDTEFRIVRSDGEIRHVKASGTILRSGSGKPTRMIGINYDVTERRLAEENLKRSEARFSSLAHAAPLAIAIRDCDGKIQWVNEEMCRRFGNRQDDYVGKTARDIHPPDIADEVVRLDNLIIATGNPQVIELCFDIPNSNKRIEINVRFPIKDKDGVVIGLGSAGLDITERRSIEQQLLQAQKMEIVGQLTGGVAHDFNNLLQVIETNLSLAIETADLDSRAKGLIESALSSGRRGASLTHQLLAFSRKQMLYPRIVNLHDFVGGMTKLLARTLGEDVAIRTDIAGRVHGIYVDEHGLANALLNLAVNARAAMPNGGNLTIASSAVELDQEAVSGAIHLAAGRYVEIAVSDTGCGMTEETRLRAFEPFFTTKGVGEGTGLGLSMVYGFARQSGGGASIESELGKGTTVRILLPAGAVEAEANDDDQVAATTIEHATKVLLVEDDGAVRKSTVMLLKAIGCEVTDTDRAALVVDILKGNDDIGLLISDVVLPGGANGVEVAKKATEIRPDLKVILVSGYPDATLAKSGVSEENFFLLPKPFSKTALAEAIFKVMSEKV